MSIIDKDKKIYFCEEGGSCFACIGKDRCKKYRYGNSILKTLKEYMKRKDI